jgi:uncharacterized protein YaeQ
MIKLQEWEQHIKDCEEAAAYEASLAEEEHGDAWEPPQAHIALDNWNDLGLPF